MEKNLKLIGKDEKWLMTQLKKFDAKPENTLIATIDGKDEFFCQKKEE